MGSRGVARKGSVVSAFYHIMMTSQMYKRNGIVHVRIKQNREFKNAIRDINIEGRTDRDDVELVLHLLNLQHLPIKRDFRRGQTRFDPAQQIEYSVTGHDRPRVLGGYHEGTRRSRDTYPE